MKANLKKAMMAVAVFGMFAGPYMVNDANAICLIACSKRTNSATSTNQTETNSVWSRMQGHTQNTYSSTYQSGDNRLDHFANNANFGGGPYVLIGGDSNAPVSAVQANANGIVNSTVNVGHSNVTAPQATGDLLSNIVPSNTAMSRSSIPIGGDRDAVDVKVK